MKIQIVFYSMFGHIYRMAEAVAEWARAVEGAEVSLLQVPELVSLEARAQGKRVAEITKRLFP
jgi:multimeric flavodoxin WrbA